MLTSPVIKRRKESDRQYVLVVSYILPTYYSNSNDKEYRLTVPAGFVFDGASIPRFFWRIAGHPMLPRYIAAAVVHDYLYGLLGPYDNGYEMTRKEADLLFYDMLRTDGVSWLKANEMYYAVRAGGWKGFRKKYNRYTEE
jgi:hypothetical protein